MKPFTILGTLTLALLFSITASAAKVKCPICGMNFNESAKTSFESKKDDKPVQFCSFSCARRFHKKFPDSALFAHDFDTGSRIDAGRAYYLAKSQNILKEIEFDMPPSVVAFGDEASAKKHQARLRDGAVVKGFSGLEKTYE